MKRKASFAIALAFIAFIVTVIVIANRGDGAAWWGFIGRIPYGDKVGHLGLIGTLSLLCNLAFSTRTPTGRFAFMTRTTLVLLVLLTLEEVSQAFIPTRSCDIFDWLADLAGLALGQTAALFLRARFFR